MTTVRSEYKMWKSGSFWLVFSLITIKTLLFTVILPPWQGPDEPFHFKMAYVVADPATDVHKLDNDMASSLQQHRFREYTDYTQPIDRIPKLDRKKLGGYYALLGLLFRPFSGLSLTGKLLLGRFLSAACYITLAALVYVISRRVFTGPDGFWLSLGVLSFVGFQPQYSFFSTTLNSDNLISLLLTVVLCCMVCIATREPERDKSLIRNHWAWFVTVLAVLMGLLVKRTGIVGFMLVCFSIPIVTYKHRRSLIKTGSVALSLLTLVGLVGYFSGPARDQEEEYVGQFSVDFEGVPGDVEVKYQAFDIDSKREVAVILNGNRVGHLKRTKHKTWGPIRSIVVSSELVQDDGRNVLTFANTRDLGKREIWGVRRVRINDVLMMEAPQGNIPRSRIFDNLTPEEKRRLEEELEPSIVSKWLEKVGQAVRNGLEKLRNAFDVPSHLIVRFFLVQFVSFWFSMGWMIYKMSLGWYALFGLITLLSAGGLVRLICGKSGKSGFEFTNMKVVGLLLLLVAIAQAAMIVAYGPSATSSMDVAMGRCRFMEIAAVSVLIPLGLWAIMPMRWREMGMKLFVCLMIFLNVVSVFKYMVPIFYL